MSTPIRKEKKPARLGWLKTVLALHLGVLMIAVGVYFFEVQNGFAIGGISGFSVLLARITNGFLSQATYMLIINCILLVLGVIILGKTCSLLTVYCSVLVSGLIFLFERLVPVGHSVSGEPVLDLVYSIIFTGVGCALVFHCKASTGGTDIIALILQKYTRLNVGMALLVADFMVAASAIFVYDLRTGLFSLIGVFVKGFIVDDVIDSMNMCKAFTIITARPDEICAFITERLERGATIHDARGVYTGEGRQMIVTVVRRSEALRLRRRVKEIDPHAFIIITKTSEIMGLGFSDV